MQRTVNLRSELFTVMAFLSLVMFQPTSLLAAEYDVVVSPDGLVSMYGENVPVEDLMNELGAALNIAITFPEPLADKVSVDFQDLSVEQAIKQITSSYILVTSKKTVDRTIKEIIILPEGESSAYLPQEGELQQLLEQDGGADAVSAMQEAENEAMREQMQQQAEELRARSQEEEEAMRQSIEMEGQIDGTPTPPEME